MEITSSPGGGRSFRFMTGQVPTAGMQTTFAAINLIRNHFGRALDKEGAIVIKKPALALLLSFRGGSHGKLDNEF